MHLPIYTLWNTLHEILNPEIKNNIPYSVSFPHHNSIGPTAIIKTVCF